MAIKLVQHHVLIKMPPKETQSSGGIIIPESIADKERKACEVGQVVQLGPLAYSDKFYSYNNPVEVGDTVSFIRYSGKLITDTDGVDYLIVNDEDILAVIRGE